MNGRQTNALIHLINQCIKHTDDFTLQNSKDIKRIWEAARTRTSSVSEMYYYTVLVVETYKK